MGSPSLLITSYSGKKLYYRNSGWHDFPVQPPDTVASKWVASLPNGTIIVKGVGATYLHFNPNSCTWSSLVAPDANNVIAAWVVNDNCVITATDTTVLHQFNGTSWSIFSPALPAPCVGGPLAFSSSNIWCLTGGKAIWHLESGVWVDRWPAACAALAGGADIGPIVNIFAIGSTIYFCGNPTASTGRVFKLTGGIGGTWSWLGTAFACVPCHMWGLTETGSVTDRLHVLGYQTTFDEVWGWDGAAWVQEHSIPTRHIALDSAPYKWLHWGMYIHATADHYHLDWAPWAWIESNLLDGLHEMVQAPLVLKRTPCNNDTTSWTDTPVSFDLRGSNYEPDPVETKIWADGLLIYENEVALHGWTVVCTVVGTTYNFHYVARPPAAFIARVPVTIRVVGKDNGGQTRDCSWTFTPQSPVGRRFIAVSLGPGGGVNKKLYVRSSEGVWSVFDPQPPWIAGAISPICLGYSNGKIICHQVHTGPATASWYHFDGVAWSVKDSPTGNNIAARDICSYDDTHIYAIVGNSIEKFDGTNWSSLGSVTASPTCIAATAIDRVWVTRGTANLYYYNGSTWVDRWSELGVVPLPYVLTPYADDLWVGTGKVLYVRINSGATGSSTATPARAFCYDGEAWKELLPGGIPYTQQTYDSGGGDIYATDEWHVWYEGRRVTGSPPYYRNISFWNGSSWVLQVADRPVDNIRRGNRGCHLIGIGSKLLAAINPMNTTPITRWHWETTDGTSWFVPSFPDINALDSVGVLAVDTVAPVVTPVDPTDDEGDVPLDSSVILDITDVDSGVDVNSVIIAIGGVTAWQADAPAPGYSGSRTVILSGDGSYALGFRYTLYPDVDLLYGTLYTVLVDASDVTGNTTQLLWSFTTIYQALFNVEEDTNDVISLPLRFMHDGDVVRVTRDVGIDDDLKMSTFVRRYGIPLFEFGAGIEELLFEPLDLGTEAYAADRLVASALRGTDKVVVLEEQIQFSEEENILKIIMPYINVETGHESSVILSFPRSKVS